MSSLGGAREEPGVVGVYITRGEWPSISDTCTIGDPCGTIPFERGVFFRLPSSFAVFLSPSLSIERAEKDFVGFSEKDELL